MLLSERESRRNSTMLFVVADVHSQSVPNGSSNGGHNRSLDSEGAASSRTSIACVCVSELACCRCCVSVLSGFDDDYDV